jgi:hypothetical protein
VGCVRASCWVGEEGLRRACSAMGLTCVDGDVLQEEEDSTRRCTEGFGSEEGVTRGYAMDGRGMYI